jgi:multiple sugar transport system substrate-binding protein
MSGGAGNLAKEEDETNSYLGEMSQPRHSKEEAMKRSFRRVAMVAVVLLLVAPQVFAGGTQEAGAARIKEVTFWGPYSGPDGELIQKLIETFNAQEPAFDVSFHVVPWGEYYDKLSINVAAGTVPDVSIMHGHFLPGYAIQDTLTPLDDAVQALGIQGGDYIPALWKAGVYNGVRYGIPLDMFPRFLFYNKRLLREAGIPELSKTEPVKGEELIPMAVKLTKGDQWGLIAPPGGNGVRRTWMSILWQNDGSILTADERRAALNSQAGVVAIQVMMDLITKHKTMPAGEVSTRDMLNQGKAAIIIDQITELNAHVGVPGLELGSAPFPLIGKRKAAFAVGHNFVIPRPKEVDTDQINATLTFVKWMTENSFEYAKVGQVPANLKVVQSEEYRTLEHQWVAGMQWEWVQSPPAVPKMREILDQAVRPELSKAMAGQQSAGDAMREAEARINKILQ